MGNKANKKTYGKAKGKIARNSGNGNAAYNSSPQKHAIKAQELSKVTKSKSTEPKRSRRELEALAAGLERDKRRNAEALENNTAKTGLVKAFNEEYMPVLTTAPAMKKRAREDDDEQLEMIVMAKRQKLDHAIKPKVSDDNEHWGGGFANITGAACYRNSLMQVLCNTPELVNYLFVCHKPEDCLTDPPTQSDRDFDSVCVSCHMYHLCRLYWGRISDANASMLKKGSDGRAVPNKRAQMVHAQRHAQKLFGRLGWVGSGVTQEDPEEQLTWLLSKMLGEAAQEDREKFDAFHEATLTTMITCPGCLGERKVIRNERNLVVSLLPKQKVPTIENYVRECFTEEISGWGDVDGCKARGQHVTRKVKIAYAPNNFMLQLQRFDPRAESKISDKISFQPTLDMTKHWKPMFEDSKHGLVYELYSVICHSGRGIHGGHYINFTKEFGSKDDWNRNDDDDVAETNFGEMMASSKHYTPYLLFYRRKNPAQQLESA